MKNNFDYIIIGAGSAGCVLANRLSEDSTCNVALLEYGGTDRSIFIQMPTALSYPMNDSRYNWGYESVGEPGLDDRKIDCPRGKVLGGSSSINGMAYVRGHACDFDEWQEKGANGWNYANCLPYFRRAENWIGSADHYRAKDGPVGVTRGNDMAYNPLYQAFIDAGQQAGYPVTDDYNGHSQEGFGQMQMSVMGGKRASTANAYLHPVKHRKNLTVITGVLVDKIIFEKKQAKSVQFWRGKELVELAASSEIICCAGSIGSPTILQRSGIGAESHLKNAGISINHKLSGVGSNLQDHLEVYFQTKCLQPVSLNNKLDWWNKFLIGTRWLLFKNGLGATNHFEACGFIRSDLGVRWPDIQYHFLPAAMRYDGQSAFDGHGFQMHVGPNKPESRGEVYVRSLNPHDRPHIQFNYLTAQKDINDWRKAVRLTREIVSQPAFDAFRGEEIQPGSAVNTDDEIDAWVRKNCESAYHASCTCAMGQESDERAVITPDCRVIGLEGLRIVDSSIFPTIPNGNLNAPTIMCAEKAADIIRGRPHLPISDATVGVDPDWETTQRPRNPVRKF